MCFLHYSRICNNFIVKQYQTSSPFILCLQLCCVEHHHGIVSADNAVGNAEFWPVDGCNYYCSNGGPMSVHNTQDTSGSDATW
jgi:hypothetical protein